VILLKLEAIYNLAYGDRKPFKDKKNAGSFFNALITGYLNEELYSTINGDHFSVGPLDLFFGLMHENYMSINDLMEGIYSYYELEENDISIDDLLSSNFSDSPIFNENTMHTLLKSLPSYKLESLGMKYQNIPFSETAFFFTLCSDDAIANCDIENIDELVEYFKTVKSVMSSKQYNWQEITEIVKNRLGINIDNSVEHYREVYKKCLKDIIDWETNEKLYLFCEHVKRKSRTGTKDFDEIVDEILKLDEIYIRKNEQDKFISNSNSSNVKQDYTEDKVVEEYHQTNNEGNSFLKKTIIGQDEALEKVEDRLLSATLGFADSNRPIASFLLTGPTGVGKTETAKQVANLWCEGKLQTVDMTTYSSKEDVSRLVGSSPGYVGYDDPNSFIEYVKKNPKCVLLFDEIDKCHRECLDILMRMLDEGEVVTAKNERVSLKNTIIFCTTNITEYLKNNGKVKNLNQLVTSNGGLRKEIVGRFDEVIEYQKIDREGYIKIAKIFLDNVIENFNKNNNSRNIQLTYTQSLLESIVDEADYETLGARAIRSSIQHNFINKVSKFIIKNNSRNCKINVTDDKIEILKKR